MRIAIVAPTHFERPTGDVVRISELSANLQQLGCDVTLLVPARGPLAKSIQVSRLLEISTLRTGNVALDYISNVVMFQEMAPHHVDLTSFDVVQGEISYLVPHSALASVIRKTLFVADMHSIAAFDFMNVFKWPLNHMAAALLWAWQRALILGSRASISVSVTMKEMLRKALSLQDHRMEVVPNGVNLKLADESIQKFKRKYDKLRELGDTIIMYVGSLDAVEGVDVLIRAMAKMRRERQSAALVVAGSGQQRSSLTRLVRNLGIDKQVYFAGWIPYQELFGFQSNADVLVAPLRHRRTRFDTAEIAFPAKIPNYLAVGKPVVATNVGDIPLVLEDEREVLIVEQGSVDALANALQRLSSDASLRKKLGKNAQTRAKEFDWKNLAARIKRLYSDLRRP